jgi:hypothetical protein
VNCGAARAAVVGCGFAALAFIAAPLRAQLQTTTLTVTGGSTTTFAQPSLADYVTGYIDGATISFTVALLNGPTNKTHTTTVEICATSATLGSGKPISKLMWQASGSSTWTAMTSSCAGAVDPARTVATQVLGQNGSYSSTVKLRMILDWTDTAASYGATVAMTVNVSTP